MAGVEREIGRRQLFFAIRDARAVPRIELSDLTGISRATVTTITADLIREGLIEEVARPSDTQDGRRGRPRVDLKIRGDARLVAGIKILNNEVSLVMFDFEGNQLAEHVVRLNKRIFEPDELASNLARAVDALAGLVGKTRKDLSGVGIGIAGIVDAAHGFVHWSPSLSEKNVEFADIVERRVGLPAYIDNDANLVAVAEKRFGLGKEHSDFIVVTIESGVGLGIVIGNELYRGARGCGAEFGHTKVQLDGALCRCGQRGCLEAYVADYALLREASLVMRETGTANETPDMQTLLAAARQNNQMAQSILRRAGRMFAMGLANLVNVFDPELIVLAGEQMQFDHLYSDEVMQAMHSSIVQVDKPPPQVVTHKWGSLMWARGAATYALDNVTLRALNGGEMYAA
ncbi:MAG: ROK family transcriptional regulator [Pseudomonadota bacterium]